MDIAVQVSPQKESSFLCKSSQINLFSFKDEETTKVSIENQLIFEIENMFKRENLQNNSYLIYRMSNNLETPFDVILNENKIRSICQDRNTIISALKLTKNLEVNEEKKLVIPIIPTQKNKIIISNIEIGEEEELKKFLIQGVEDQDCEFIFDRKNCCRVVFKDEIKTQNFFNWISNQTFKTRKIHAYFEPENLYITFLQNIQEKKQPHKSEYSMPTYYYSAPVYPESETYPMMDSNPYFIYPPYGIDPYRFMPPPYYTNFFIRKANDNDEEKSEEDYAEGGYYKKKPYDKRDKYYPKEYNNYHYKTKPYVKEHEKGGYNGKPVPYNTENRGYEHGDKSKGRGENYKERKPYDYSKKPYYKDKNKPYGSGNQKYYYEPKQLKDDAENFPPLIVKEEGKTIEVSVVRPETEENRKEMEKDGGCFYNRKEIVEIFQKLKKDRKILMNPALEKTHEDVFHLIEKDGDIRLEFLEPKAIKIPNSTNTTPLMSGMNRPPVIMEEKKE